MRFEWDPAKARENLRKHDVSFSEAMECFGDRLALEAHDDANPGRLILIGMSRSARLLLTVFAEKDDGNTIRIISARKATKNERRHYEEDD